MKNINLEPNNYYFLKILLYIMISIFIFLFNSKIIFSVLTNKNTQYSDYILVLDQLKQANATKISIANPPGF